MLQREKSMSHIKTNIVLTSAEASYQNSNAVAPRVSKWNTTFETLLADSAGLHSFAEFLKQEYSHENIYFWTACERYKQADCAEMRKILAREIFSRHMAEDALMPVNVDAGAHKVVTNSLDAPDEKIFIVPQEQVFKLMKYDSYSRFTKSSLFKVCEIRDQRNQPLPYPGDHSMDLNLRTDKALMTPESHRRRSTSFTEGHIIADKMKKGHITQNRSSMSSMHEHGGRGFPRSPGSIRKGRPVPNNDDTEMYEYLKITDKQLDDQRGTHINFEMPDFLKNNNANISPKESPQANPQANKQKGAAKTSPKETPKANPQSVDKQKGTEKNGGKPPTPKRSPKSELSKSNSTKSATKVAHKNLDDQRGTAINSEMPEFLKTKNVTSAPKGINPPKT